MEIGSNVPDTAPDETSHIFALPSPLAVARYWPFGLKAIAIEGIQTGTLTEARDLIDLVRDRKLTPPPISERPLGQAQAALDALRQGQVVGRSVLTTRAITR